MPDEGPRTATSDRRLGWTVCQLSISVCPSTTVTAGRQNKAAIRLLSTDGRTPPPPLLFVSASHRPIRLARVDYRRLRQVRGERSGRNDRRVILHRTQPHPLHGSHPARLVDRPRLSTRRHSRRFLPLNRIASNQLGAKMRSADGIAISPYDWYIRVKSTVKRDRAQWSGPVSSALPYVSVCARRI